MIATNLNIVKKPINWQGATIWLFMARGRVEVGTNSYLPSNWSRIRTLRKRVQRADPGTPPVFVLALAALVLHLVVASKYKVDDAFENIP